MRRFLLAFGWLSVVGSLIDAAITLLLLALGGWALKAAGHMKRRGE